MNKILDEVLKVDKNIIERITDFEVERVKEKRGYTKELIYDTMFKSVFIQNKKVLLQMIKDVFDIEEDLDNPLAIVGFETVPYTIYGKSYRGDILVKLSDKTYVSIEMNSKKREGVENRNIIQLVRIHNQVIKSGETDSEIEEYQIRGLNLNYKGNKENKAIRNYAFCDTETGKIINKTYLICDINLEKCLKLVYTKGIKGVSKKIRWGAILILKDISKISKILGDDMISMEDKEKFLKTIEEVNNTNKILKMWMIEDNTKWAMESEKRHEREEGIEFNKIEMIKNMLKEKTDYKYISKISGKSIEEIKAIEKTMLE